jgi:hypothetical protein
VALLLPVSPVEKLILVLSLLGVLLAELINTAIETVVDRISSDQHPLSMQAKDLASAAVALAVFMAALCWHRDCRAARLASNSARWPLKFESRRLRQPVGVRAPVALNAPDRPP